MEGARRFVRSMTILLALTTIVAGAAPVVAAASETVTVDGPSDTYHVTVAANADPGCNPTSPSPGLPCGVCEQTPSGFECGPPPLPSAGATVEVWREANGCDGLQREAGDCDDDGAEEPSDEPVLRVPPNPPEGP